MQVAFVALKHYIVYTQKIEQTITRKIDKLNLHFKKWNPIIELLQTLCSLQLFSDYCFLTVLGLRRFLVLHDIHRALPELIPALWKGKRIILKTWVGHGITGLRLKQMRCAVLWCIALYRVVLYYVMPFVCVVPYPVVLSLMLSLLFRNIFKMHGCKLCK